VDASKYMLQLWDRLVTNLEALDFKGGTDLLVAVGTMIAAIVAAVSAWYAARTVKFLRGEFQAHTFLSMIEYERDCEFSKHMDVIRSLKEKLFDNLSPDELNSISVVVNFLNHVGHLIRNNYVIPKQIILLYSPSISECERKLTGPGQWLQETRRRTGVGAARTHAGSAWFPDFAPIDAFAQSTHLPERVKAEMRQRL
jgi:hypothetical protein